MFLVSVVKGDIAVLDMAAHAARGQFSRPTATVYWCSYFAGRHSQGKDVLGSNVFEACCQESRFHVGVGYPARLQIP